MALKNNEKTCFLLGTGCESAGVLFSKDHRPEVSSSWTLSNQTLVPRGLHRRQNRQHIPKAAPASTLVEYEIISGDQNQCHYSGDSVIGPLHPD